MAHRVMEDKWAVFSFGAFADFPERMDYPAVFGLGVFSSEPEDSSFRGSPLTEHPHVRPQATPGKEERVGAGRVRKPKLDRRKVPGPELERRHNPDRQQVAKTDRRRYTATDSSTSASTEKVKTKVVD